ncbi:CLUMA_CG007291, isoform A [Clunio marinus]|uniref:CLUMA_CG007291, isoform A n=1 Tax=Clunio marinus TaxID=568069 RepID=A0A1J1I0P0_9DIPT|nr:CLUMA_CG007291, isoform A [Clunio marinus]
MAEEYERFEITDYDLDNEFNPNRNRRRPTKKQQIYGIWADDSDEDEGQGSEFKQSSRKGAKDYTAPVSFISGGVQQSGKKKEKVEEKMSDDDDDEEDDRRSGLKSNTIKHSSESEEEVRPSFKPQQTAGMRQSHRGLSNKGLGDWEQHTRGIGAKLLLQMGYQPGKGLGKTLQGIAAPVEAHVRKGRGAIGAYGPEKKTKPSDLKASTTKKQENKNEIESGEGGKKQWSKSTRNNKRHKYKSVEDVIEKGKKPEYVFYDTMSSKADKVTVIDMTGPEKRVLSGYHALRQSKVSNEDSLDSKSASDLKYFQLPELMHNLNIIVNICEQDIIANDKRQRNAEDRHKSLKNEQEQLERIVTLERKYIETLEDVMELVERLTNADDPPTLEEAEKIFIEVKVNHPNEFKEFNLGDLASGVIAPLISAKLKNWNALRQPTEPVSVIKKWADLLGYSKLNSSSTTVFDPYPALIWSCIIPFFRVAAAEWNPRSHAPMAALLDTWSSLIPDWMLDNVLEQIILLRLAQTVNDWDPLTDICPIHTWIHPWTNILGTKMEENIYKTICEKLSKALRAWNPQDRSAYAMILPWKNVFRDEDLQMFLHKNVVPKLEHRMSEIVFNPIQQDLEIFNQVWEWNELVSSLVMANILDKYFFPKWMQTLVLWLNQSPNFDEVSRWYSGWKGMFSDAVLKQTNVSEHFRRALELMQRATGMPISISSESADLKPPPLMDLNILPPPNLEFKEMVSQKCAEREIIFAPMPGRREKGKQVYRIGKLFCYIEKSVCFVSLDGGINWMPISLNTLLDKAITG